MNILVTGGAGYIGSHACKALAAAGYTPVAYDSLINGHERAVQWGPLVKGDIRDGAVLSAAMERYAPAAVMHFAAFAYVGESVTDPAKYYLNNVYGSLCLLEAMRTHGCRNIVFSSSCAVYGYPETLPLRENHPRNPINPYGRTKLSIEYALQDFGQAYGINAFSLRYFNAAGADPQAEIGETHDPETHLIPLVLQAALRDDSTLTVFGTDYDTPDGTCIRDYIHVADLAGAHIKALERLLAGDPGGALNLGTGTGFSVRQIIEATRAVTGRDVRVAYGPRRPGDPPVLVADSSLAASTLGWHPDYTDIQAIIETALRWQQRTQ